MSEQNAQSDRVHRAMNQPPPQHPSMSDRETIDIIYGVHSYFLLDYRHDMAFELLKFLNF